MRLGIYALLTGLALAWSILVWHVWSDNAYLSPYLLGELTLLVGVLLAAVASARSVGIARALMSVAVGGVAAYMLVGPLGVTRPVAEALLSGGNGSQSPCLVELRRGLPEEARRGPPPPAVVPQVVPAEARESEIRGLMGATVQSLVPFVAGAAAVAAALRRVRRGTVLRAAVPAAAVIAFVFARGAASWCGELFGLDSLVALLAGAAIATVPRIR